MLTLLLSLAAAANVGSAAAHDQTPAASSHCPGSFDASFVRRMPSSKVAGALIQPLGTAHERRGDGPAKKDDSARCVQLVR